VFGTKRRKEKAPQIELWLGGDKLKEVDTYRYLGTTLDSTMSGTQQLAKLHQNIALKLNRFRKSDTT
jgi:hypothetical protein